MLAKVIKRVVQLASVAALAILFGLLCALLFQRVSAAAPEDYAFTVTNIKIREVPVIDLMDAESIEDIEYMLFPTGMELPTKYLDFFSFFDPFEFSLPASKEVAAYLNAAYPDAGAFTMAEVKAAELYLGLLHASLDGVRNPYDTDVWEASQFLKSNGISLTGSQLSTIVIEDLDKFKWQIAKHQFILNYGQMTTADPPTNFSEYQDLVYIPGDGSPLMGFGWNGRYDSWYCWQTIDDSNLEASLEYNAEIEERVAYFWQTRSAYMEQLGLGVATASNPIPFVEAVKQEDMWRYPTEGQESLLKPLLSIEEWRPEKLQETTEQGPAPIETTPTESAPEDAEPAQKPVETVSPTFNPQEQEYPEYVTDFSTGQQSNGSTAASRTYGFRDFLLIVSIVIVVMASVALFVVDTIRKRKDPMRTFRWKRK